MHLTTAKLHKIRIVHFLEWPGRHYPVSATGAASPYGGISHASHTNRAQFTNVQHLRGPPLRTEESAKLHQTLRIGKPVTSQTKDSTQTKSAHVT